MMVHDVSENLGGKEVDLKNDTKEVTRLNLAAYRLLDKNTSQKAGYWKSLVKQNKYADLYLTPKLAMKHKLATQIGIPHIETEVLVTAKLV